MTEECSNPLKSYFAPPGRSSDQQLTDQALLASNNPLIRSILCSAQGLVAVLNSHRQIVAVNDTVLEAFGISHPEVLLGQRPGEALGCVHSKEMPAGCGTSRDCRTCGAVISIVTSVREQRPVEQTCIIMSENNGRPDERSYAVRACPVDLQGETYVLLYLRDTTQEERRICLERTFFHDVNNIVNGLQMASELLLDDSDDPSLAADILHLTRELKTELDVQRAIASNSTGSYTPYYTDIRLPDFVEAVRKVIGFHSASRDKFVEVSLHDEDFVFSTDLNLLKRIIVNMMTNAFEASEAGATVTLSSRIDGERLVLSVNNPGVMDEDVARKVFRYQFSTKSGGGRGIGTYSMKLLGEDLLGAKVSFTSSEGEGTTFSCALPLERHGAA